MNGVSVFLSLGTNLGNRLRFLQQAVRRLDELPGFQRTVVSSVYETSPLTEAPQPRYLNAVVAGRSHLPPLTLLDHLERLERRAGRTHKGDRAARELDVDLLLYGEMRLTTQRLILPHPRLGEREFVLRPLAEVAPELHLPDGRRVHDLLSAVAGTQGVERLYPPETLLFPPVGPPPTDC